MAKTWFDENTFLGYRVNTRLFWVIFTLLMVFLTSPLAHLPFLLGYGPIPAILIGAMAVVFNLVIPLYVAHRSWRNNQENEDGNTVLQFKSSGSK